MEEQRGSFLPTVWSIFNPFGVLQPEKVRTPEKSTHTEPEFSGSFLTANKNASVIDVFDNLYVTPQHVSSSVNDDEITKFLDKYEDPKVGVLIDIDGNEAGNTEIDGNIKVLEPKLLQDDSDLIDELIFEKTVENNRFKEVSELSLDKVPKKLPKTIDIGEAKKDFNVIITKTDNKYLVTNAKDPKHCDKRFGLLNNPKIDEIIAKKMKKQIVVNSNKSVFIETVAYDPKKRRLVRPEKEISGYTKGADLNEKSVVLVQMLERLTKRKSEKEDKNNLPKKLMLDSGSVIKSKNTNSRETKNNLGAHNNLQMGDLKVNLQEIVSSGNDLNKIVEEISGNIKRQILLDLVNKIAPVKEKGDSSLNPEVLMEDCNKERLRQFERRRKLENFILVCNGKI